MYDQKWVSQENFMQFLQIWVILYIIQKNVCGYIMKHLFLESLMQIIHETALRRANVFDYEVIIPF